MIQTIIIEDEKHVIASIKDQITACCANEIKVIAETGFVKESISLIKSLKPQLLLLDIELKDGSGFDLLKSFPDPLFKVVFISSLHDRVLEALKSQALDFVAKPIEQADFAIAMKKAKKEIEREEHFGEMQALIETLQGENRRLRIPYSGGAHFVPIANIIYLEADAAWTYFYLVKSKNKICSGFNIKTYEKFLTENQEFFRIHNTYIISRKYLKEFRENGEVGIVVMDNGVELPVARQRKKDFKRWLEL